jgi:hypothetical protein
MSSIEACLGRKRGAVLGWQQVCGRRGCLDLDQKDFLTRPFTMKEVEQAVQRMKTETVLGPNGFPVIFYKKFWGILKWWIMRMFEDFYNDNLNLSRINFGIIVLLPKVKEVITIKQYRPCVC